MYNIELLHLPIVPAILRRYAAGYLDTVSVRHDPPAELPLSKLTKAMDITLAKRMHEAKLIVPKYVVLEVVGF